MQSRRHRKLILALLWCATISVWVLGVAQFLQLEGDQLGIAASAALCWLLNPTALPLAFLGVRHASPGWVVACLGLATVSLIAIVGEAPAPFRLNGISGWPILHVAVLPLTWGSVAVFRLPLLSRCARRRWAGWALRHPNGNIDGDGQG